MYVYLIMDPFSRLTKIGKSINPKKRFNAIRNANPFAELYYFTDEYSECELHNMFSHKRVELEWFALDKHDIYSITKSYSVIPKRLHYTNTKADLKRINQTNKRNELLKFKFDHYCDNIPNILFEYNGKKEDMKAYNVITKKCLKQVLKGGSLGFVLNSKFYSTTAICRTIKKS